MAHAIKWFEIPVTDINRAARFYGAILAAEMAVHEVMGKRRALLPFHDGVGGSLVQGAGYVPSKEGALLYLDGGGDLDVVLRRVGPAGGRVLQPKMSIGEYGFVAIFIDTEGNRVGLHSRG
jgi:predicted enzyme related to lactoylglutathione lyase